MDEEEVITESYYDEEEEVESEDLYPPQSDRYNCLIGGSLETIDEKSKSELDSTYEEG